MWLTWLSVALSGSEVTCQGFVVLGNSAVLLSIYTPHIHVSLMHCEKLQGKGGTTENTYSMTAYLIPVGRLWYFGEMTRMWAHLEAQSEEHYEPTL